MAHDLKIRRAGGGRVEAGEGQRFRLMLPPTARDSYALAQLDNYMHLRRGQFPHHLPVSLQLEARVSAQKLPGTWGFGFWNDPFSAGFGAGGMRRILPVLPNAAWFFYGSDPNHLSFRERLPGQGFHAKVFRSPLVPSIFSLFGLPAIPFMLWPPSARLLRRLAGGLVKEDAAPLSIDVTAWHRYRLDLSENQVDFEIDGERIFSTPIAPRGRLGLVIWMDNQFFKFTSEGKIGFGFLDTDTAQTLDVQHLSLD